MAINETVKSIEDFPNKSKTVTLDLQKTIPLDNQGDEIYTLTSAVATGTAKIGGGTINQIYIREFKTGFAKSSGFKNPPFTISSSNTNLRVSIDGSSFETVTLEVGTGLTGENIAQDLQTKISALAGVGQNQAGNLAFLNATVFFKNNRFHIISGSMSNTYVGVGKSSVQVLDGLTLGVASTLGFNLTLSSEDLASIAPAATVLTATYTGSASDPTLNVSDATSFSGGYAFMITNGTNKEYFVASGVTSSTITISGSGLAYTYSGGSLVQRIFERDPDGDAIACPYNNVDDMVRWSLRSQANQIDFSA